MFDLYDDYVHNRVNRRFFFGQALDLCLRGAYRGFAPQFCFSGLWEKIQIKQDDPRLDSGFISYESPKGGGTINGLLSKPADAKGKLPGIVMVHENRGLNPHIQDVARRTTLAGFISLAPHAPATTMPEGNCKVSVTKTKCRKIL